MFSIPLSQNQVLFICTYFCDQNNKTSWFCQQWEDRSKTIGSFAKLKGFVSRVEADMVASTSPPPLPLPASHRARVLWKEQVYSVREPITPWKVSERPPNNPCQHMKVMMTGHWTKCVYVCLCGSVWPIGEGCLHLNWVHSLGLGGLLVFNVTRAGQNDLCGTGRHHSLNPPPLSFLILLLL